MSDVAAYLLEELSPDEQAAFERAMAADPALRAEVERLRPVVSRLEHVPAEAWNPPEPPPLQMPERAPRRSPRRLVLRPLVAVAAALALLVGGAGLGVLLDRDAAPSAELALRPVGDLDRGSRGDIAVSGDGVTVRVSGLRPTTGGQFYELWLLGDDGRLVGLGAFRVGSDGAATLKLPLPADPGAFRYFDLSLEPGDGDPGHSGVSVLRGPTV
jgi:anti-sigma-K factor RskA